MNQVTKVRKYLKREQWKTLIKECQSSGMTVTAWCHEDNICEQTYYRNLKILRAELCENFPASTEISERTVAFKKLEVQTPVVGTQAAVINKLNGAIVEVNEGTSQQTIQAVLLALKNIC